MIKQIHIALVCNTTPTLYIKQVRGRSLFSRRWGGGGAGAGDTSVEIETAYGGRASLKECHLKGGVHEKFKLVVD